MKKRTLDYLTPECVIVDIVLESVLCASPSEGGSIIDDFIFEEGNWN